MEGVKTFVADAVILMMTSLQVGPLFSSGVEVANWRKKEITKAKDLRVLIEKSILR